MHAGDDSASDAPIARQLAELAVDGPRRDAEELRGDRLVALRVAQRLADDAALDLVERRADREA